MQHAHVQHVHTYMTYTRTFMRSVRHRHKPRSTTTNQPHNHETSRPHDATHTHSQGKEARRRSHQKFELIRIALTNNPTHPQPHATRNTQRASRTRDQNQASRWKMLASTMQISNNNPTNPHHPTRERQAKEDQNNQQPAPPPRAHAPGDSRPDSSGPNSVLDPVPHQREATSNPHHHPRPTPHSSMNQEQQARTVDDSTSETPPCASRHSPLVGVRAP